MHNLVGHPASEVAYWVCRIAGKERATRMSGLVHDLTLPRDPHGEDGRG